MAEVSSGTVWGHDLNFLPEKRSELAAAMPSTSPRLPIPVCAVGPAVDLALAALLQGPAPGVQPNPQICAALQTFTLERQPCLQVLLS